MSASRPVVARRASTPGGAAAVAVAAGDGAPGAHVIRPVPPQDGRRLVGPAVGRDRHDGPARLEFLVVVLGLVLGDAGPDEGPDQPGDAGPGRRVREDDAQGAGRDGRADDGDHPGQDAEAREGPQAQAGQRPGDRPRPGMRVVGIGRGGRPGRPFGVPHGDADLVLAEPGLHEFADGLVGLVAVLEDADDGGALLGSDHRSSPGY